MHQEEKLFPSSKPILKLPSQRLHRLCKLEDSGKSKLDNNKGSQSCFCLPISHACIHTALYIGHASRARITSISSASRPPIHTINHSREEENGSLHYINDIVHTVFYKVQELSQCGVQHPLTFEVHDPREGTKLLNRSVYLWAT